MSKQYPKVLYQVVINYGGFVHNQVYTLNYKGNPDGSFNYYDKSGTFGFDSYIDGNKVKLGLKRSKRGGCFTYTVKSQKDAEQFLLGAQAVKEFIKEMVING